MFCLLGIKTLFFIFTLVMPNKKQTDAFNISRYSLSGKLLQTYPNARLAALAMNSSQQHISTAARNTGKIHTACGYLWRRGNAEEVDLKPILKKKWYGSSPLASQQHTVGQYDLQGNLIGTHANTIAAAKAVGVHQNGIRDVIKGRGLTYGGFIWSKTIRKKIQVDPMIATNKAGISQYDLDGRWIRSYKTGLEASKATGIGNDNISLAIKGSTLTAGGFLWRKGRQLRINVNELRKHPRYETSVLHEHMKDKRKQSRLLMEQKKA